MSKLITVDVCGTIFSVDTLRTFLWQVSRTDKSLTALWNILRVTGRVRQEYLFDKCISSLYGREFINKEFEIYFERILKVSQNTFLIEVLKSFHEKGYSIVLNTASGHWTNYLGEKWSWVDWVKFSPSLSKSARNDYERKIIDDVYMHFGNALGDLPLMRKAKFGVRVNPTFGLVKASDSIKNIIDLNDVYEQI